MKIIAIEKRLKLVSKVKIGRRLFIGFSLLLVFILLVGVGSMINVSALSNQIAVLNEMMDTEKSVALARVEQAQYESEGKVESADKAQEYIEDAYEAISLLEGALKNSADEDKPGEIRELLVAYEANLQTYIDLENKKIEQDIERENASEIVKTSIQESMILQKEYSTTQVEAGTLRATFDKYSILGEALDSYQEILVLENVYVDEETDELSKDILGMIAVTDSALMSARAIMKDETVQESLVVAREALEEYKITFEEYAILVESQIAAKEEMDTNAELVTEEINGMKEGIVAYSATVKAGSNQKTSVMLIVAFIFGVIAAYVITISITHPLRRINKRIQKFAAYNVSEDLPADLLSYKDEMGLTAVSLQTIVDNMKEIIGDISDASETLSGSAHDLAETTSASADSAYEVSDTIEEISRSVSDQAGHSEDGARRSDEIGKLIVEDQKQIRKLNQTADEVTQLKEEGLRLLEALVEKTDINKQASQYVYGIVKETNESAQKIESASQMIQNIAEQTNLLALNAAIEAASAGEAGRGFAVVAAEIRKLAEQSNQFSGEISAVIALLMKKSSQAVDTMKNMQDTVEEQSRGVRKTNDKFEGIAEEIESMRSSIGQINASGEMLARKKDQVIRVMEDLSAISEENAASTEDAARRMQEQTATIDELSLASTNLSELAKKMNHIVKRFEI